MLPPTRQLKKLWEIIDLNYGKWIDKSERVQNIANPIYGANGVLSYTNKFIYDGESIIIWRKWSAGALTRVSWKFRPSDVTYYITTKVALNMDYLFYGLHILNIPSLAQGIKPWINRNDVYSLMFPLPPLPVQHTIVTALDQASASISASKSALQSQIDALDALWQSSLSEGMNNKIWTLTKLWTICDFVRWPFWW
jgi:type I restriction enzyme S subunit